MNACFSTEEIELNCHSESIVLVQLTPCSPMSWSFWWCSHGFHMSSGCLYCISSCSASCMIRSVSQNKKAPIFAPRLMVCRSFGERSWLLGGLISSCGGIELCPQLLSVAIGVSVLCEVCCVSILFGASHREEAPAQQDCAIGRKHSHRAPPWSLLALIRASRLPLVCLILAG